MEISNLNQASLRVVGYQPTTAACSNAFYQLRRNLRNTFVVFLFFLEGQAEAQDGYGNHWIVGYDSTIDIQWNPYKADTINGKAYPYINTSASISDKNGNFLFTSNGESVMNIKGDTILNGFPFYNSALDAQAFLNGGVLYQASLFLPDLSDSNKYLLFIRNTEFMFGIGYQQPTCLCMSVIDSKADSGKGAVLQKNKPILQDTLTDAGMTAVKHANGRDWWIITHEHDPISHNNWDTGRFYITLMTPDTFITHEQWIGNPFLESDNHGQMAFSSSGNLFAFTRVGKINVLKFDRCTGFFSKYVDISNVPNSNNNTFGDSFSPNDRFLYVSYGSWIAQYDLWFPNLSIDTIGVSDTTNNYYFGQLENAPDGKIYVGIWSQGTYLSVINNPNGKDTACNFQLIGINLNNISALGIPNMPNYELKGLANYEYQKAQDDTVCLGGKVQVGNSAIARAKYEWKDSTGSIVSTMPQPLLTPNQTTTYYLTLTDTSTFSSCNVGYDTVRVVVGDSCPLPPPVIRCDINLPTILLFGQHYQNINLTQPYAVNCYNILGELIYVNTQYAGNWIPPAKGIYFIKVKCVDGGLRVKKLVVQ